MAPPKSKNNKTRKTSTSTAPAQPGAKATDATPLEGPTRSLSLHDRGGVGSNICTVCFDEMEYYAVGACNHRVVCHRCSLRSRALLDNQKCVLCRTVCEEVVYTTDATTAFDQLPVHDMEWGEDYGIYYEDKHVKDWVLNQFKYICQEEQQEFPNINSLKAHTKAEHSLFYCDLCVQNVKIFFSEQVRYTKANLNKHRKKGDSEYQSAKGHPMCKFCETRFFDNDALFEHLRQKHYQCPICTKNGDAYAFYADYDRLEEHFQTDDTHIQCQEPECLEAKFIVFGSQLEYKAHYAQEHGKNMTQSERRKATTLDLEFQYASSSSSYRGRDNGFGGGGGRGARGGRGGGRGGRDRERDWDRDRDRNDRNRNNSRSPVRGEHNEYSHRGRSGGGRGRGIGDPTIGNDRGAGRGRGSKPKPNTDANFASIQGEFSSTTTSSNNNNKNNNGTATNNNSSNNSNESKSGRRKAPTGFGTTLNHSEIASQANASNESGKRHLSKEFKRPEGPTSNDRPKSPAKKGAVSQTEMAPIPQNAAERNSVLIQDIKEALSYDPVKFQEFKTISKAYRTNALTSGEYYLQFNKLLGPRAASLFSELVSLLPELNKQKELLAYHNDYKSKQKQMENFPPPVPSTSVVPKTNRGMWANGNGPSRSGLVSANDPPLSSGRNVNPAAYANSTFNPPPLTTTTRTVTPNRGIWASGGSKNPPASTTAQFPPMYSESPSMASPVAPSASNNVYAQPFTTQKKNLAKPKQ
ncbi:hypothetical protein SARC_08548, partial [Sphaeroforma arctica JP610]